MHGEIHVGPEHRIPARVMASGLWLRVGLASAGIAVLGIARALEGSGDLAGVLTLIGVGATGAYASIRFAWSLLQGEERPTGDERTPALRTLRPTLHV